MIAIAGLVVATLVAADAAPPTGGAEAPASATGSGPLAGAMAESAAGDLQVIASGGPLQEWISGVRQPRGGVGRLALEVADPAVATMRFTADLSQTSLAGEIGFKVLTPRAPLRAFATLGLGGAYVSDDEDGGLGAVSLGAGVQMGWGPVVVELAAFGRVLARGEEGDTPASATHAQLFGTVGLGYRFTGR